MKSQFSIILLRAVHKNHKMNILENLDTDMYLRLLIELIDARLADRAEMWVYANQPNELNYRGVRIRFLPHFAQPDCASADVIFARGDIKEYVPALQAAKNARLLFYPASTRGIPRRWNRWHGILLDDLNLAHYVARYYPNTYFGEFFKTAAPEIFHPIPDTKKPFDVCVVANMASPHKQLDALADILQKLPHLNVILCGPVQELVKQKLARACPNLTCPGRVNRTELNRIFNASKLALVTAGHSDAAPRILVEFQAANLPVLANDRLCGAEKFVLPTAGQLAPLHRFPELIPQMLDNLNAFDPISVFNSHFSPPKIAQHFCKHLDTLFNMPQNPPKPSWRGKLVKILRPRLDKLNSLKN